MNTPIFDFVNEYISKKPSRFHMPGHKGINGFLGVEARDITEIDGADELYLSDGIIAESEANASSIFGCHTFYSTEGSSLAIRAGLTLLVKWARLQNKEQTPLILAGRNAHKTLINASITLDFDIDWIMPKTSDSYESCSIDAEELREILNRYYIKDNRTGSSSDNSIGNSSDNSINCEMGNYRKPCALYITSPDYLGNICDVKSLAAVCHEYGLLLFVDNAHGAYLKFLSESLHPMDLGADLCADSAHKTLPVLTGGAYLHVAKPDSRFSSDAQADVTNDTIANDNSLVSDSDVYCHYINSARHFFADNAKNALALFGSTSPSYIILQSLDLANVYMNTLGQTLLGIETFVNKLKNQLQSIGYQLVGNEALKITVRLSNKSGHVLASKLYEANIIPEYYDNTHLVFMISSGNTVNDMWKLIEFFENNEIKKLAGINPNTSEICEPTESGNINNNINSDKTNKNPIEKSYMDRISAPVRIMSAKEAFYAASEEVLIIDSIGRVLSESLISCPPAVPLIMSGEVIDDRILENRDWLQGQTIRVVS